jgi:hypothetical protein
MTLVDTEPQARRMFEEFHAKPSKRRVSYGFSWPSTVQEVGRAVSQLYRSNKWKMNPRDFEDYKHIAEAPQYCYAVPGFLRDSTGKKPLQVYGEKVGVPADMPKHFTILAPLIGIQIRLYDKGGKLPKGDNGLYEIAVPHGLLGGARFPDNEEAFLLVYTRQGGVHMLITGKELDVEKDGIVG